MPDIIERTGALARDSRDHDSHFVSVRQAKAGRATITNSAWTLVGGLISRRNHILLQTPSTNPADIIIQFSDTGVSNDTANDTCGISLTAGSSVPLSVTANIPVYARVAGAGANCRIAFAEML